MLFQIKTINGQKTIVPLTTDTGAGAPVGSLISMYKKSSPSGYLYCDGSTFDETAYPALYQYLGSNVLPDYREFALVGAEENTTSSNIADHDIYTEGQEKDDCIQAHKHNIKIGSNTVTILSNVVGSSNSRLALGENSSNWESISLTDNSGRSGATTRGKRKAVFFYIKATSGLTENQQENVLNTINENLSYSTEEHATGKTWIDGKPIYEITITETSAKGVQKEVSISALNIDNVVNISGISINQWIFPVNTYRNDISIMAIISSDKTKLALIADGTLASSTANWNITLEYTKNTD